MLTKGVIMLSIGAMGLVLTIIWILADLVNKSKHEEKMIQNAVKNSARMPIRKSKPIVEDNFVSNKEIYIPINLQMDSEINNEENTAMVDNITSTDLTEALVEESTEKLIQEDELDKTESIIKIHINQKIEVIQEETVGLDNKEEMTESLIKREPIEALLNSEKTEGLINEEVTEYLDKEEITDRLDEFAKVSKNFKMYK